MEILNKIIRVFKKGRTEKKISKFSDFLINASSDEKIRLFTDVAHRANEEQREIAKKASLKLKSN